jgi:hypothetical protein
LALASHSPISWGKCAGGGGVVSASWQILAANVEKMKADNMKTLRVRGTQTAMARNLIAMIIPDPAQQLPA